MITKVSIVLGTFFGDCSKGQTVFDLTDDKTLVVRFSGGPQCGHRVVYKGIEHVFSLVGSGAFKGAPTYLHENVYVNPIALYNELEVLFSKGIYPTIFVHPRCRVITPYDILNDWDNNKVQEDGTCGCGIHATFKRSKYKPIFFEDVLCRDPHCAFTFTSFKHEDSEKRFIDACVALRNYDKLTIASDVWNDYEHIIFEGSQGLLLDMDNGFMPHCTPSRVGLNGVPEELLCDAEVYLVMRSYLTRHGNGYDPQHEKYVRQIFSNLDEPTNLDTGLQGRFKIGIFDTQLMRDAFVRHRLDNYERMFNVKFNVVVTHMDCTPSLDHLLVKGEGPTIRVLPLAEVFKSDVINIRKVFIRTGVESGLEQVL